MFHHSAELAYKRLTEAGPSIRKSDLEDLAGDDVTIQKIVSQSFKDEYWKTEVDDDIHYTGIHNINFEAICIYLKQLLAIDAQHAPFTYLGSEHPINGALTVDTDGGPVTVRLGGIIDRMDQTGETVRIIDYKTGGKDDDKTIKNVDELFDRHIKRKEKVFQAFYYAWLMCQTTDKAISPGLFFVRSSSKADYDPAILINKQPVANFRDEALAQFDSDIPYTQAEKEEKCRYCDFCAICGRKPPTV